MNPYASEANNRIKVKSQPKPQVEDDGKIDHPLFEGKKIDMSKQELRAFTKAMEHEEFKSILHDYVKEISDPGNKAEYELYLRQLEEQGDLPVGTKLIQPISGFCIKTTSKKLISDINKQYFDQKTFINICMHEHVQKPQKTHMTMPNGQSGYQWQLPYSVSKPRHDQDKKGILCSTYDVVFNRDIGDVLHNADFKKFVCDTALDGVNRVLAEHKEKCSSDYKILKNLKCKGGEPGLMTVKIEVENKLLGNADVNKHETKLQKDVTHQADEHKQLQKDLDEQKDKAHTKTLDEIDEENEDKEEEEPMPKSVVQPKYKVVYSYPVQLQDCWEGPATSELIEKNPEVKVPKELTVTISVPHVESMKLAQLDINESNLVFEYPKLYYLDLNLKYKCNKDKGVAKYDKTKKTLTIRVPVIGLTEDSQKVFDENLKLYQDNLLKRQAPNELPEEAAQGSSTTIIAAPVVLNGSQETITDNYNLVAESKDLKQLGQEALKEETEVNEREQFLKIYKEDKTSLNPLTEEPVVSKDIKFKTSLAEEEDTSGIKITGISDTGKKPLIQEIKSLPVAEEKQASPSKVPEQVEEPIVKRFNWEEAERVEAKVQFFHQKEFVFVNLAMKGYSKLVDVRYALSENELFLEVKDSQGKVHKLSKTLFKEVDVEQSSVELLVDFISVKLKKLEKDVPWDSLGYDIKDFTIPTRGQLKSNFLSMIKPKEELIAKQEVEVPVQDDKENDQSLNNVVEEVQQQEVKKEELEKQRGRGLSYLNLESSIIYKIY